MPTKSPAARAGRRVALRLLRRVRDYAQVMSNGHIEARNCAYGAGFAGN
ncbi:MAG: hypothetical protein R2911_00485 [Caldilineaceae bacterium]